MVVSTLTKIRLARILYGLVRIFTRKTHRIIRRDGILYAVDLTEGIDFSLFLFGGFQDYITKRAKSLGIEKGLIVDVGANVGVMTLRFAKLFPQCTIVSFEATPFAFEKFARNLELNPGLSGRIRPIRAVVVEKSGPQSPPTIYSSWKIDGSMDPGRHPIHGGTPKSPGEVNFVSLDDYFLPQNGEKIRLIKIDTEGSEWKILQGADRLINRDRPFIIFEFGAYILNENNLSKESLFRFFESKGYSLADSRTGKPIHPDHFTRIVPTKGTIDILAIPGRHQPD